MTLAITDVAARPSGHAKQDEVLPAVNARVMALLADRAGRGPLRILEAGGGSSSHLVFPPTHTPLYTTLDISPEQLARNRYADEKILADIQTFDPGERRFDIAVAWDVLEHVERPAEAAARLAAALAPGGVLLVKGPIPSSAKGVVTRLTPHAMHVAFYRAVLGDRDAGKPGHAPFPTVLSGDAGPDTLAAALRRAGCAIDQLSPFVGVHVQRLKERFPPLYLGYAAFSALLRGASFGTRGGWDTDFALVAVRV